MAKKVAAKATSKTNALNFIKDSHDVIKTHLESAIELPDFFKNKGQLTLRDRRTIVQQARLLLQENFVHLPLKEAMHGINPLQQLSLLEHRLEHATDNSIGSEYSFHRQMLEIFTSLRDLHTNYLLPEPFCDHVAFMPFSIEEYYDGNQAHYIATHLVDGFSHNHFKKGVEIIHWSGVPITRAIEVVANQHAGSNEAARHARGIDGITLRALKSSLPPDESWVIVGYRDHKGVEREMRQEWIVSTEPPSKTGQDADVITHAATTQGLDIEADIQQKTRKMLFAPQVVAAEQAIEKAESNVDTDADTQAMEDKTPDTKEDALTSALTSALAGVFRAKCIVNEKSKNKEQYGYVRIYTFNIKNPVAFINEFIRLVSLLPRNGLIIDVRGNGGGHIWAAEGLLQTLTPYAITPEPTQFINTSLNADICGKHNKNPAGIDLSHWHESIRDAIATGAIYSRPYPITTSDFANRWGQHYHGPVVLITDARCYSATDLFAAGFQDHMIGTIIGIDKNTGAGGANVWTHSLLKKLSDMVEGEFSPYETLPKKAGMRVSIRRTLRVGDRAGTPVEDIGVTPDIEHKMTKNDLLNGNEDLINCAIRALKALPVRQLDVDTEIGKSTVSIKAVTRGLDRLDTYIDDRPMSSVLIKKGATASYEVELPKNSTVLSIAGHDKGDWVATRSIQLKWPD